MTEKKNDMLKGIATVHRAGYKRAAADIVNLKVELLDKRINGTLAQKQQKDM